MTKDIQELIKALKSKDEAKRDMAVAREATTNSYFPGML